MEVLEYLDKYKLDINRTDLSENELVLKKYIEKRISEYRYMIAEYYKYANMFEKDVKENASWEKRIEDCFAILMKLEYVSNEYECWYKNTALANYCDIEAIDEEEFSKYPGLDSRYRKLYRDEFWEDKLMDIYAEDIENKALLHSMFIEDYTNWH